MRRLAFLILITMLCYAAQAKDTSGSDESRDDAHWTRSIERITSGIVTIQIDQTRSFDTEQNM